MTTFSDHDIRVIKREIRELQKQFNNLCKLVIELQNKVEEKEKIGE